MRITSLSHQLYPVRTMTHENQHADKPRDETLNTVDLDDIIGGNGGFVAPYIDPNKNEAGLAAAADMAETETAAASSGGSGPGAEAYQGREMPGTDDISDVDDADEQFDLDGDYTREEIVELRGHCNQLMDTAVEDGFADMNRDQQEAYIRDQIAEVFGHDIRQLHEGNGPNTTIQQRALTPEQIAEGHDVMDELVRRVSNVIESGRPTGGYPIGELMVRYEQISSTFDNNIRSIGGPGSR